MSRRSFINVFIITALFVTGIYAELKIGYVNSEKILAQYEGVKSAQDKFDKEVAKWEQEATERQKEMQELRDQLEKQSLMLSEERKKEIEDKLRKKMVEYQQFIQQKFGQQGEAAKKNEELLAPIVERINTILEQLAKTDNYDFIFDIGAGGLVWGKKGYDLTERVMQVLNKEQ